MAGVTLYVGTCFFLASRFDLMHIHHVFNQREGHLLTGRDGRFRKCSQKHGGFVSSSTRAHCITRLGSLSPVVSLNSWLTQFASCLCIISLDRLMLDRSNGQIGKLQGHFYVPFLCQESNEVPWYVCNKSKTSISSLTIVQLPEFSTRLLVFPSSSVCR